MRKKSKNKGTFRGYALSTASASAAFELGLEMTVIDYPSLSSLDPPWPRLLVA